MAETRPVDLRRSHHRAFTLIELLMTLAIIIMLVALLLPALKSVRARSRSFHCQLNLRSVAFDFGAYARTEAIPMDRGDDEHEMRNGQFRLETFQESQYRVDEFWDRGSSPWVGDSTALGVMGCQEVRGTVQLTEGRRCRNGAVTPEEHVSYAMNLRLDRSEAKIGDQWVTRPVRLNDRILLLQQIPLIWDIDGLQAKERRITPHFSAPPGDEGAPYGRGQEWFPAMRRHGTLQVAFNSGEVLSSPEPLDERSWRWTYNP